jgi:hypothetical protein
MNNRTGPRWMRRAVVVAGAVAALASVTAAAPAQAARGGFPVEVVAHTDFTTEVSEFESNLSGCASGTVVNGDFHDSFTPWGGIFVGEKVFTCSEGDSGFTVSLKARFGPEGSTGTWNLVDAWGELAGVKGSGSLVGIIVSETLLDDVYTGIVR